MESVQQLYDLAFHYWESGDIENALENIEKALTMSPNDLSVHALAMHIYKDKRDQKQHILHAEFIIDHDIHYIDKLNKYGNPYNFHEELLFEYSLQRSHLTLFQLEKTLTDDTKAELQAIMEKEYEYSKKLLTAGYGLFHLDDYFKVLKETGRYDELIELSYYVLGVKSGEDLGLPGLKNEGKKEWLDVIDLIIDIMDAFFYTGRNEEALLWCMKYQEKEPEDYYIHLMTSEVLCRLNRPADCVRQWITAIQKSGDTDRFRDDIDDLCRMVADKNFYPKYMLHHRISSLKDQILPDRKGLYQNISLEAFSSIGKPDKDLLSEFYVEGKLEVKLPPVKKEDYFLLGRFWFPKMMGDHPYLPPDPGILHQKELASETLSNAVVPNVSKISPVTIEKFGIDLTERSKSGKYPPVIGRDREIDAVIRILIRMEKNNPVLLGEAGVGKTAIILGLAQRINAENVPAHLKGKRIIELPMSALVGGTMWRGDFEKRITDIIKELRENKDIILFVDELHTIMGAGAANRGDLDVANIAKPALAKGEIRLVGATTNREYSRYIEKDQAMARRFTPVHVGEMDREATLSVLKHRVNFWREHHKVDVSEKTLVYAIDLTEHHVRNRRFPDKAIDLLDESCAFIRTRKNNQEGQYLTLSTDHINHVFREWTGAVIEASNETMLEKEIPNGWERKQVKRSLAKNIVAQKQVVTRLTSLILQVRHTVKDPMLPFVLLFSGPPGTGKSTSASALAQTLWPNEQDRIMVLNLAEYSEPFSYDRLVGGPPGFAGYNDEGILTSRIKRKPFSVVVLKNFHRAYSQVINFFSSLFRTGMFTDRRGHDILANDVLFIIHFDVKVTSGIGFSPAETTRRNDEESVLEVFKKQGMPSSLFKVYFNVFEFYPLTRENMNEIVKINIKKLKETYAQKGMTVRFTGKIQEQLVEYLLAMPMNKRNVELLMDQYIIPKMRDKLLKSKTIKQITIDSE
jgi:ATP-dependent Clp protease ATP-binding subunit ClpC